MSLIGILSDLGIGPLTAGQNTSRLWMDRLVRLCIVIGGLSVLAAILALFIFLVAQVVPLFKRAEITSISIDTEIHWSESQNAIQHSAGRWELSLSDPEKKMWQGTQWHWAVDENKWAVIHESALGKQENSQGNINQTLISACLLNAGTQVLGLTEQGSLFSWHWVGAKAGPGRWIIQDETMIFDGAIVQGLACDPDSRRFAIWSHEHWALGLVENNEWVANEWIAKGSGFGIKNISFNETEDAELRLLKIESTVEPFVEIVKIDSPHADVSWETLILPVNTFGSEIQQWRWSAQSHGKLSPPKYSVLPLLLGTLKVALLAMCLALPLAISAATYTSHFMAGELRSKVKPAIELIEAVPTVVLGFIAVMAFGPWLESHLFAFTLMLILLPLFFILSGFCWSALPSKWRRIVPEGWEVMLVVPLLFLGATGILQLGEWIEDIGFPKGWLNYLSVEQGVDYQSHNLWLTGIAMGLALVPSLYSIAEDALFGVPQTLKDGSLALGATPWQTLSRVVLPMASPGIFAAIMIGFGRALGETMIVLMVSGNNATTHWNIFEGLRSIAATLVMEMPESNPGSTHYHLLFLLALLLFVFTFLVNTLGEVVRYRLRSRFGVNA